jgi:hypothetical protein
MSDTLLSILCGEDHWVWDSNNANTISFHKDGTGEVSFAPCSTTGDDGGDMG